MMARTGGNFLHPALISPSLPSEQANDVIVCLCGWCNVCTTHHQTSCKLSTLFLTITFNVDSLHQRAIHLTSIPRHWAYINQFEIYQIASKPGQRSMHRTLSWPFSATEKALISPFVLCTSSVSLCLSRFIPNQLKNVNSSKWSRKTSRTKDQITIYFTAKFISTLVEIYGSDFSQW